MRPAASSAPAASVELANKKAPPSAFSQRDSAGRWKQTVDFGVCVALMQANGNSLAQGPASGASHRPAGGQTKGGRSVI